MSKAIDWIAACPTSLATVTQHTATTLRLEIRAVRYDGPPPVYDITVQQGADVQQVIARETLPSRLPAFCPERHINPDGTFCLGWPKRESLAVHDCETAYAWLETLCSFLALQERATDKGEWPERGDWAHGAAAQHQFAATMYARDLGCWLEAALAEGRITTERRRSTKGTSSIIVRESGRRLYAVWERSGRIINPRRPCLCRSTSARRARVIAACGDHAQIAVRLALALDAWKRTEAHFWNTLQGYPCCGTMKNCPLNQETGKSHRET